MNRAGEAALDEKLPLDDLEDVFERWDIRLAICFGSYALGRTHDRSDVDLAIEFEHTRPGDEEYTETFFGLYRDVTAVLDTENVDIVDVHSLSNSLGRSVVETGVLVYGDSARVENLRDRFDPEDDSPRERLDAAIERIDEKIA